MDQELKARKLGSAVVRRQRMEQRQAQMDLLRQQRNEDKERMNRYGEAYSTDSGSDASRSNSPENDSSVETPSEYSVRTPQNSLSPEVEIKVQPTDPPVRGCVKSDAGSDTGSKEPLLERRRSKKSKQTSLQPNMFGASLNRLCDFRYDRFSTIIEPDESKEEAQSGHDTSSSAESDGDEEDEYSPIEVATPVAIRMAISRPSVIAVASGPASQAGPQRFSVKNINTILISPKPTPATTTPVEPSPSIQPKSSSFLATEAKSVEMASSSSASMISVELASTRSLPAAETRHTDTLKKKSSMPMLTKFSHSRMHSIKNFIKPQSISGPPPAVPQMPPAHQSRPSDSADTILFSAAAHRSRAPDISKTLSASPRRSMTEAPLLRAAPPGQRPQTARTPSQNSITALPSSAVTTPPVPPAPAPAATAGEDADGLAISKKKSFSNLRRRSGSIGQVLKFGSSKNKPAAPEGLVPPIPALQVHAKKSVDSMKTAVPTPSLTPTPKTPRSVRKSGMMYSPFPPPMQKGDPIGLGLRM